MKSRKLINIPGFKFSGRLQVGGGQYTLYIYYKLHNFLKMTIRNNLELNLKQVKNKEIKINKI